MNFLIVSGGTPPSEQIFLEEISKADFLIAADSGCETFIKYNVTPDLAVGDFDSISENKKIYIKDWNIKKFNPEKDSTDSEIACLYALSKGATNIALLGVTGTRIDHVLGNVGLLKTSLKKGVRAYIRDDNNFIYLVCGETTIPKKEGKYISFIAYSDQVLNFSISGAKYELNGYNLKLGDSRTVSNEFLNSDIKINFDKGLVLVIYSND